MARLGVQRAENFTLRDLRRSAARALVSCKSSLATLLAAGSWSSRAFILYLDKGGMECSVMRRVMLEAVDNMHSDDEA